MSLTDVQVEALELLVPEMVHQELLARPGEPGEPINLSDTGRPSRLPW